MAETTRWLVNIPIHEIADLLEWRLRSEWPERLVLHYFRLVDSALTARAKGSGSLVENWRAIHAGYVELPALAQLRFSLAPVTYGMIARWSVSDPAVRASVLQQCIDAERALNGMASLRQPTWTALGDCLIDVDCGQPVIALHAPRTHGGITVDFDSPWSAFAAPDAASILSTTATWDRSSILERLNAAEALLSRSKPCAIELVQCLTRAICVRDEVSRPQSFCSSSWSREIGKTGLANVLASSVTTGRLASALVHEAIHSLLYIIETIQPTFASSPEGIRFRSPWTGRLLPISSLTHACFVWYGLFWLWHDVKVDSDHCEWERSAGGFDPVKYSALLNELRPFLDGEVSLTLQAMGDKIGSYPAASCRSGSLRSAIQVPV